MRHWTDEEKVCRVHTLQTLSPHLIDTEISDRQAILFLVPCSVLLQGLNCFPLPVPGEAPALSFRNAGKQPFWGGLVLVRTGGMVVAQRHLPSQLCYGFTPNYKAHVATVGKMWVLVEPGSVLMQGLLYLESMVCNYLWVLICLSENKLEGKRKPKVTLASAACSESTQPRPHLWLSPTSLVILLSWLLHFLSLCIF